MSDRKDSANATAKLSASKDKFQQMIRSWIDQFAHVLQSTDTKEFIQVLVRSLPKTYHGANLPLYSDCLLPIWCCIYHGHSYVCDDAL